MSSLNRRILDLLPRSVQPVVWRTVHAVRNRFTVRKQEQYFEIAERRQFFRRAFKALSFNEIDGDYAEFGCFSAMTFGLAYQESRQCKLDCRLWAFDSFQGLPDAESPADEHPKWHDIAQPAPNQNIGHFHTSIEEFRRRCWLKGIPASAYETVAGFYSDTLADTGRGLPRNIGLAYIDCDLHSSTRDVLRFLMPRLKHGMIIACDDYYCWSASQAAGERRALVEAFRGNEEWRIVPYVQFGWHGMSFVVERKTLFAD